MHSILIVEMFWLLLSLFYLKKKAHAHFKSPPSPIGNSIEFIFLLFAKISDALADSGAKRYVKKDVPDENGERVRARQSEIFIRRLPFGLVSWYFDRCFHMWYTFKIDFMYVNSIDRSIPLQLDLCAPPRTCVNHSAIRSAVRRATVNISHTDKTIATV